MRVVILAHLGLLFPRLQRFAIENKVPVVMWRGRVLNPEVARGDLAVFHPGSPFHGRLISPDPAKAEDSGGRAPVTFGFNQRRAGLGVETKPPGKALLSTTAFPRSVCLFTQFIKASDSA